MTAEQYLQSLRDMAYKISTLEKMRDSIVVDRVPSRAITYDDLRVQTSPTGDALENAIIGAVEEEKRIEKRIKTTQDTLYKRQAEALEKIMQLKEGQCRRFLVDYYIHCESMSKLTREYGYTSKRTTNNLKKRALKYYEKVDRKVDDK